MRPISFACTDTLALSPADIAGRILDLANWTEFTGYAVLPGIRAAEFEVRTPGVVGSRIRVTNTDGSKHVEEIVEWQPEKSLRLHMNEFSAPLSRLATSSWSPGRSSGRGPQPESPAPSSFTRSPPSHGRPLADLAAPQTGHRPASAADE